MGNSRYFDHRFQILGRRLMVFKFPLINYHLNCFIFFKIEFKRFQEEGLQEVPYLIKIKSHFPQFTPPKIPHF